TQVALYGCYLQKMNLKLSHILTGLLFAGLMIGPGFMQTELKSTPQLFMLLFGLLTLGSLVAKQPFKTSILFYIFHDVMPVISIFLLASLIVNRIMPDDGWVVDDKGERYRVMGMNRMWRVLARLLISPAVVFFWHR